MNNIKQKVRTIVDNLNNNDVYNTRIIASNNHTAKKIFKLFDKCYIKNECIIQLYDNLYEYILDKMLQDPDISKVSIITRDMLEALDSIDFNDPDGFCISNERF